MLWPHLARLRQIVRDECRQRAEEGCAVGELVGEIEQARDAAALTELYEALCQLVPDGAFPYAEPVTLDEIRAARPPATLGVTAPDVHAPALSDRILGGWLGRCAGMLLGKPFECPPFGDQRGAIRRYLQAADAYPLADYAPQHAAGLAAIGRRDLPFPECQRGNVRCVVPDDDIHYTIMGLEVLEARGAAFTTADVAAWWLRKLPATCVFTAEEAAYRNLMSLGRQYEPHTLTPAELEQVRTWLNPYREWIGAQIRADGWALACPGQPARAAEFAFRDASLSHVKNGVYGAMLCAGMIAAAAVSDDPRAIVQAGLEQIPAHSRLADAVRRTQAQCAALNHDPAQFEDLIAWLWAEFGHYHPVHTINNAAAVVGALLLGGHDYERVITIAVMCGWDTDCNGATAGCVAGTMLGAARLPAKWIAPLNDTLNVDVPGYRPASISACAARHVAVARRTSRSA